MSTKPQPGSAGLETVERENLTSLTSQEQNSQWLGPRGGPGWTETLSPQNRPQEKAAFSTKSEHGFLMALKDGGAT